MAADYIEKFKEFIRNSPPVEASKKLVLPGFDGMPIYDVAIFFVEGMRKGSIITRASAISFKFFLALFPALIFIFTLIPFVPIDNFQNELLSILIELFPESVYKMMEETITDIITNPRGGLLSFGFLITLYLAANGIDAMFTALNESIHVVKKDSIIKSYAKALLTLFILLVLVIIAIGAIIITEFLADELIKHSDILNAFLLETAKWIIIIALYFFAFSIIYYLGSSKKNRWRFISAGSTLATALSILLSLGFSYYVNNFGQYNKFYGSLGTLIVVLLWIYFNSIVLLLGYELNISLRKARISRKK